MKNEYIFKRESNYDLLRIISCIAIITIHMSSIYVDALNNEVTFGNRYTLHILTNYLYECVSRFAVPCFVMLSGAFILDDDKNANYYYFYMKIFKKIGIPVLFFSFYYLLYSLIRPTLSFVLGNTPFSSLFIPFLNLLKGQPYYHMWYLYMMIGVYVLSPVVIRVKKDIGEKTFERVTMIFLILACFSAFLSMHKLNWDIGLSFCYLGYFMAGYVLRKRLACSTNKAIVCVLVGVGIEVFIGALRFYEYKGTVVNSIWISEQPYSPLIVMATCFIFYGFSNINVSMNCSKLSYSTFNIYLFHAGVLDILMYVIKYLWPNGGDSRVIIPVGVAFVFILSLFLSLTYDKIWNKIEKNFQVTIKLCSMFNRKETQ